MPRSGKTDKDGEKHSNKKFYMCLCSCCLFWFILCVVLVTALVFIGRHLLHNTIQPRVYYTFKTPVLDLPESRKLNYKKLPNDTRPILYNITLLPYLDKVYFEGFVNISIDVFNPKRELVVHSKSLTIISVDLVREDVKSLQLLSFTENLEDEVLVITPKEKLFPGRYFVGIKYRGKFDNKTTGLYKSTYEYGYSTRTIATSKFEPTYARQAFPCFDEPNMKAKYIVHLLKPKQSNYIALSNYPVSKTESYDDSSDLVTFEETVSMSTYLTCFIVSDFTYTNTTFENDGTLTPLRVYASPGNIDKTTYAGETAKKVIEYYVTYFGIPYPLPKLDMVAIPDFVSGAMEHWGLVTYRETALLYTDSTHSSSNKQRVATVIAHELAHSWFGNLVTMDWWNDLWLNEGFASYIEFKGTDAAEPTWNMMSQFQTSDLHPVLSLDATLSSHAIVVTVTTPDEITSIFDTISYNKGASILRMLEDTVGETNFQKGVKSYLEKYAYGNAVTKHFLDEIQSVIGSTFNISEMMDTFTAQMGYPIVNVTYDATTGNYTLTQKRFLKDPDATYDTSNITYGYKWTIPITYVSDQGKSTEKIFFPYNEESIQIKKPDGVQWLKFNFDQIGYYRVNYDNEQWQTLINRYSELSVMDRTHLIEETFSIAEAGLLSYNIPLDLTRQLVNETSYTPWSVASSKLQAIHTYLTDSSQSTLFKDYIKQIVSNAYNNFTWVENDSDDHLSRLSRLVVLSLACVAEDSNCLNEAQSKFNSWIDDTSQTLSQDLRSIVYKYGMVNADESTWYKLLEIYEAESDANEKLKLINGLANVKNTTLLEKLLELTKDTTVVRSQDYFTVLGYISVNTAGTDLIWDFVRNNWEYLVDRFTLNDRYLGQLIRTITSSFSTAERLAEMQAFFNQYPDAGAGASSRKTALETVENNIRWLERYKSTVESWITELNEN
ncbi:glutamyl aminopeptidase-like isoform X2 [Sitophilus oryzae]|uniref:Aminopeptidase n=1 Tax=Sitophilus oryzae TaxID=7048 RepID=A0A6J2YTP5_SITOR|nr:glutamyl aminopeptidase-like isoform X2 [Sitophilus oryzae]